MATDNEFIQRLIEFGLTDKEAQLYLNLLKHGPRGPSRLAKALITYRKDVHRTLISLIDRGMVRPSLDSPTIYAAVDLDAALDAALKKHESEMREMELRKQALQELSKRQQFRPSDEVTAFKIIKSNKELVTAAIPMIDSLKDEWLLEVPGLATVVASSFGINQAASAFIQRGGKVKVIVDISYPIIDNVRELLNIGEEVRHIDRHGVLFVVFDRKQSITAIEPADSASLTAPMVGLWTNSIMYAEYLATTFEMVWKESIPAEKRIQQLLQQGPPQA
jgi:sugar-specific transcriptional regulator TrmB